MNMALEVEVLVIELRYGVPNSFSGSGRDGFGFADALVVNKVRKKVISSCWRRSSVCKLVRVA